MTTPYTLLSQDASHILRLVQQPYATTLQHYSDRGCDQIALDDTELAAFLRALPRAVVLAALGANADADDTAAWALRLAALDGHIKCPACGVCTVCGRCACPQEDAPRYRAFPCPSCGDEQPMTPGQRFACSTCQYTYTAEPEGESTLTRDRDETPTYYDPVWNPAAARYGCRHCGLGAVDHTQEAPGVLRCPSRPRAEETAPLTLDLDTLPDDAPLPIEVLTPQFTATEDPRPWWRRQPGAVCACDAHAGVHVADAACHAVEKQEEMPR